MAHPKERPDLSRREFLRRAAAAGIAVPSLGAILAACRDSSEPTPSASSTTSGAGPTTAGVLADFDHPMELAVHDDIQPIEDGLSPEAGPLRVYNWNLYIFPRVIKQFEEEFGVEVELTQFTGMAEAMNKINNGTIQWDVFFPTIENVSKLATAKRIRPWNRTYMENTANIWPSLLDPWYDKGGRYTLPYLTWKTGIGYRRDFVDDDFSQYEHPFDVFWDTQYAGKVGVLDEYRETIGMALLRNGGTNFNSTDPAELARATDSLIELIDAVNVEIGPGDYQKLAEGTSHVRYSWSGNMNFARWYLADPDDPEQLATLGYYYPEDGGWEVANDTIVLNTEAESPVLAHAFINFLMDRDVALTNFGYEGFQPPLVDVTAEEYLDAGGIPPTLENTLITEEDFAQGQPVAPLSPEADQLYQDEWARFKAGAA